MKWLQKIQEKESPVMGFSWEEFLGVAIAMGSALIGIVLCGVSLVIGSLVPVWMALGIASVGTLWSSKVGLCGSSWGRSSRV